MSRILVPSASQARPILIGTALLLTLGMGIRQSYRAVSGTGHARSRRDGGRIHAGSGGPEHRLGPPQALVGATADRFGLRITMMAGAAIYVIGLGIMAVAQGALRLIVAGGLMGVALSCTATSLAHDGVRACGFGRAAQHDARCRLRGRIARHARGAARQFCGLARARAVAGRDCIFRVDGGHDAACCLLAGGADKFPGHGTTTTSMREGAQPGHAEPAVSRYFGRSFRLRISISCS